MSVCVFESSGDVLGVEIEPFLSNQTNSNYFFEAYANSPDHVLVTSDTGCWKDVLVLCAFFVCVMYSK